jgi:uncharacterized repeat protein (TIGR03847 family)
VSESFQLDAPEHFTAGAIGPAGKRVFYLQAREGRALVTLKCEKEQVAALGEYLAGLLAKLPAAGAAAPATAASALLEPLEPAWPVASIGVGYDEEHDRIVVVAGEQTESEEEEGGEEGAAAGPEPASAHFAITRAQAAAFIERARALVRGGRPNCPMCGEPKDPAGHVCPRANGHVVARE